jgi:cytochrome b subunit of formate dehydrogenase
MRFSCVFEILMVLHVFHVVLLRCLWLLHVHVAYLWFKQYIKDACGSKEHQLPNNMYYATQAWKYNNILEI